MRRFLLTVITAFAAGLPAAALAQPVGEGPVEEGPIDEGPVEEGPVEPELVPPVLDTFVQAEYPARALADKVEASVVLQIDIDATGKVEAVEILTAAEPAGYGFDEAALEAARRFIFKPAMEQGKPIPVRITYRYGFKLDQRVKEPEGPVEGGPVGEGTPEGPGEERVAQGIVNFTGLALERGTRDPLVGVIVTIFKGEGAEVVGFEAVTDEEGRFQFYDLEPADWKVLIELQGYFPFRTVEEVSPGQITDVVYFVERGTYNPFDVLVEAERVRKEVSKRTISAKEIETIPGTFGDPVKVVRNLPGVARVNDFSGDIIVRGSSPEDTQLFASSVNVPIVYHFGGLRSVIPLGMIDGIEFYPGNFSVYYGRAIGGILDIDIKDLQPERIHGYADVSIFDTSVYLESPIGEEFTVAGSVRRSYIDGVLNLVIPDNAPVALITAPVYYDYQLSASWRPNRNHRLNLFLFASNDQLELIVKNPSFDVNVRGDSARIETDFLRGILEHVWTPTDDISVTTKASTGTNLLSFEAFGAAEFRLDVYQPSLRETVSWAMTERTKFTIGLDAIWSKTDIRIRAPGTPPKEGDPGGGGGGDLGDTIFLEINDSRQRDVAGFFELELKATDDLLVVPGFRVDYFEIPGAFSFDPRVAVRWDVDPEWTLKGGVGLFHQAPTPDETAPEFGNPDLNTEAAVHYSAGVEYRPTEYLLFDVTGFYKDMFDLVARSNRTIMRDGELVPENYDNGGLGRVYGMEVLARHNFANNFYGWISYTLSRAERRDSGETAYRLFDFDQTHILTVIGSWALPRNWELGLRWRYVTGSPTTLNVGGVYDVDELDYDSIKGETNGARFPAFHQLDLRVDKRWIYETWTFNVYLDVQNVYNRSNVEGFEYNYDFSQRQPSQGLPILPIVGVKAEF